MAAEQEKVRVAVNGYGVIGKCVVDALIQQGDMTLVRVADIVVDWRLRNPQRKGFRLFAGTAEHAGEMREAGHDMVGSHDELLDEAGCVNRQRSRTTIERVEEMT